MKRVLYRVILLVFVGFVLTINVRLHRPGGGRFNEAQLRYLERALSDGAGERMQSLFPEGYVFTWALYGLASAQVAAALGAEDPRRVHHLSQARQAVEVVRSPQARSSFVTGMDPPRGAFYTSWSLYVLAEYIRAAGPSQAGEDILDLFRREADSFARALDEHESPFLESYPSRSWPADTAVGVAALGIYNSVVDPRYEATVRGWILRARRLLDEEIGALSHAAVAASGSPIGGVRGGSLALMSRVLIEADRDFALEQYDVLRDRFVDYAWGVPGVREYPLGVDGVGDVDSGPIILGFAGPAVVVGAAAANVHGDTRLASTLLGVVEAAGLPMQLLGRRRYAGGLVPIGDAFIVWARSSAAPSVPAISDRNSAVPRGWYLPIHLFSILLCTAVFLRARHLLKVNAISSTRS